MDINFFLSITDRLRESLDDYRFVHTFGVAFTASSLAMRYGFDTDQALLAGLLHDCAKCIPNDDKYRLCEENGIELTEYEKRNYSLVHAKLGAFLAETEYGAEDRDVLEAVRTHTTGAPDMSMLQKIVYTADFIEPNRDDIIADMNFYRALAFEDIDEAVYLIEERSLRYLAEKGREVDPLSLDAYNFYKNIHDSKK